MYNILLNKLKILARKNIARYNKILKNTTEINKKSVLNNIYKEQAIVIADAINQIQSLPTLGHLRELLEKNSIAEGNMLQHNTSISANDIKRWALKSAVDEYYKLIQYNSMTPIVDAIGSLTTKREFAPNKEYVYKLYMNTLESMIARKDAYKLDPKVLEEISDKGIPQGGAFEKNIERYREEFMTQLNFFKR